jgi:hypothetical protein
VNAEQRLARERPAEPVAQQLVECANAERSYRQALDRLLTEGTVESWWLRSANETPGQQHANIVHGQSAEREGERAQRGWVEPLNIIDGDHDWLALAQKLQHVAHRHGERTLINGIT